jgi:hypothetical protein
MENPYLLVPGLLLNIFTTWAVLLNLSEPQLPMKNEGVAAKNGESPSRL